MTTISSTELTTSIAPNGTFAGLIFDCDGTLANTMPNHFVAWTKALAPHKASFPEDLFYSLGGMPTDDIVRLLNSQFDYDLDVSETHRIKERHYTELLGQIVEIKEVVDIARAYKGVVPMAVASGGIRRIVEATLSTLSLTHLFDAIITADDVTNGKPAPDIFLLAAEKLGVRPEDCIVYEDGVPGIEAAKSAGMRVIDVRVLLH